MTRGHRHRWLDESSKTPSVYTFSYGRHSCLGMSLALAEIKMVSLWLETGEPSPVPLPRVTVMVLVDCGGRNNAWVRVSQN